MQGNFQNIQRFNVPQNKQVNGMQQVMFQNNQSMPPKHERRKSTSSYSSTTTGSTGYDEDEKGKICYNNYS
jgi:hypothetical protein